MKSKTVKGFTLTELIVVIAIMGILAAILIPSIYGYYADSRFRTMNSNARIIFNSAQTIAQRCEVEQRVVGTDRVVLDGADGQLAIICEYGTALEPEKNSGTVDATTLATAQSFCDRVNTTYDDAGSTCWAVLIEDYIVRVVLCTEHFNTQFVGRYPNPVAYEDDEHFTFNENTSLDYLYEQAAKYADWNYTVSTT